jgi:L-glutamine:2-deoxy-scyllo-inosose/3-amino-2,3-dideoxy-scyllo-inosose aminotransferase
VKAVPVLVDVCEDTWCIDPEAVEKAITARTRAIIPVHMYGSFANMDAIMDIGKHDLYVIEDCSCKHGGEWKGKKAGSIGDIGSFSLQLSKLLTAGEGGVLTTNDHALAEKLDALRNCGRRPEADKNTETDKGAGVYGDEGNFIHSGNYLNSLLKDLPGVSPMRRDERETHEAYYNFAFRYNKDAFRGLPVSAFRKALGSELGIGVEPSYEPLNHCSLYMPLTKPWRYGLNDQHWKDIDPSRFELPVCERVHSAESVCIHHKVLLGSKADMDRVAEAIRKVYDNAAELT